MMPIKPSAPEAALAGEAVLKWQRLAARVAFYAFLLSLLFGILVPVYTDEVGWRLQERAGIDGGVDRMYNDICGANTIAVPPFFMLPFRYFSAWLNLTFPDPLYVRLVGVFCAGLWAFMFKSLIGIVAASRQQQANLTAISFGLLGMGLLPWFLVWSRPEHPILLASTAALLIAGYVHRTDEIRSIPAWLPPLVVVPLAIAAMSYHMKGILFLPLFCTCAFFAAKGKSAEAARFFAIIAICLCGAMAANYWVGRFSCPGDPVLAALLDEKNIASQLANGGNWREALGSAIMGANPNRYIMMVEARPFLISHWLPDNLTPPQVSAVRYVPMLIGWNLLILLGLLATAKRFRES
jgi:hypothetical protein